MSIDYRDLFYVYMPLEYPTLLTSNDIATGMSA